MVNQPHASRAFWLLLFLTCGCAREERAPSLPPAQTVSRAARPGAGSVLSPAVYVERAAETELFIIRSSEMALSRSTSATTREFATTIIEQHKGTSAQLSLAARRLNLLPSAVLDEKHQTMLDALAQTADFDPAYRRAQLIVHQEALALQSQYAARGTSPTLRPVAQAILPTIERDLRLLKYL